MSETNTITLHNGVTIPTWGFDAEHVALEDADAKIRTALEHGCRYLTIPLNHTFDKIAADAIRSSGIDPHDLILAGAVSPEKNDKDSVIHETEISLRRLERTSIDLLLLRNPGGDAAMMSEPWHALETLYKKGMVRAIGVDRMGLTDIETMLQNAEISPMIGRVDLYPGLPQEETLTSAHDHRIEAEGCLPDQYEQLFEVPAIKTLASKYGASCADVLQQYIKAKNCILLWPEPIEPKSKFYFTEEEMKVLDHIKNAL
ncbi:MAG: aldo/keto reductase [Solobacterium sp.]|jgi:diketogulonate reductase-like aldo/keto reductase|nr:aldo/keto reductase [Solobacterium sp.]MCH4222299.1 aldo/keto reductase [Solobacterium sp.]MCH4265660.1 aldo/keto reductase [Solobacterium sp.]